MPAEYYVEIIFSAILAKAYLRKNEASWVRYSYLCPFHVKSRMSYRVFKSNMTHYTLHTPVTLDLLRRVHSHHHWTKKRQESLAGVLNLLFAKYSTRVVCSYPPLISVYIILRKWTSYTIRLICCVTPYAARRTLRHLSTLALVETYLYVPYLPHTSSTARAKSESK